MNNPAFFIVARLLIPSVFVGLGLERLLVGAGILIACCSRIFR
jgi:hypothetical protein